MAPEPYRLLFPLGALYAIAAALVWPLHAAGWIPYPATLHWTLMVQGFLHCFVLGFLLTASQAFLHSTKVPPWETLSVSLAMLVFGALAIAGRMAGAQASYLATIAVVAIGTVARLRVRRADPPEEFLFVFLGLALAALGAVLGMGIDAGWWTEPAPRFSLHVFTRGVMLSIVLGLGGLLVPTFTAMREPLVIPGIARPGERRSRRILYVPMAALIVLSLVLDAMGRIGAAAQLRLIPVSVLALLVWKIFRRPGRPDLLSWTLWCAGWLLLLGLWAAALVPARAILAYHLVFLGGFGLLILGIGTRVVVSHGRYPVERERRVLGWTTVILVAIALLTRIGADFAPGTALLHYALSGGLWIAAWAIWGGRAVPLLRQPRPASLELRQPTLAMTPKQE